MSWGGVGDESSVSIPNTSTPPNPRPRLLLVGRGDPLEAALRVACERHGLLVETVELEEVRPEVHRMAPDLVLLVGDAAAQGGGAALDELAGDPVASVVPVAILAPDGRLESRVHAFQHGAAAVVPRSASADQVARRVARLCREPSGPLEEKSGELGEATFDELVELVKDELRSGIFSVDGPAAEDGSMRVVLGAGRPVAEAVQDFVARLRPLVTAADSVHDPLPPGAGATVGLLELDEGPSAAGTLSRLRALLADDDPARADALAQELRARGAIVSVTDTHGRGLERALGLDPQVAIVDAGGLEGLEVVRAIRRDTRLRWASLLVAPWNELGLDGAGVPDLERLAIRVEPLLEPERELAERARSAEAFDARLESTGPSRMLRVLVDSGATLHLSIRHPEVELELDLAEGLVVGAKGRTAHGETVEGPAALATALALGSGHVRVEPRSHPAVANVMSPVDEALALASSEPSALAPSPLPPPPPLPLPLQRGTVAEPPEAAPEPRWGTDPEAFVPLHEDIEGASQETRVEDLAGLARAGEALLGPAGPSAPTDAPPAPETAPIAAEGGPVAANERHRPHRRHRSTLIMGAPLPSVAADTDSLLRAVSMLESDPAPPLEPPPFDHARPPLPPRGTPLPALPAAAWPSPEPEPSASPPDPVDGPAVPRLSEVELEGAARASSELELELEAEPTPEDRPLPTPEEGSRERAPSEREWPSELLPSLSAGPPPPWLGPPATLPSSESRSPWRRRVVLSALGSALAVAALGLLAYGMAGGEPGTGGSVTPLGASAPEVGEAPPTPTEPPEPPPAPPEPAPAGTAPPTAPPASEPSVLREGDEGEEGVAPAALLARAERAPASEAERLYRRVLVQDPRNHYAMIGLGQILLDRGAAGEAVEQLRGAVRRRPRRVAYRVLLGDALAAAGDASAARREWEQALAIDPEHGPAQQRLGR